MQNQPDNRTCFDVSDMSICSGSGGLFGPFSYDGGAPTHEQRCLYHDCEQRLAPWHAPRTDLPEPRGDFPEAVCLCYCCAQTMIPSGSKFSSFFCDECQGRVVALNRSYGLAVVPLGRHSLMNGVAVAEPAEAREIEAFASGVRAMFGRIDRLLTWQRGLVQDNVAAMGRSTRYVAVPEYVAFTSAHGLPNAEMFRQLCRFFGADPQRMAK